MSDAVELVSAASEPRVSADLDALTGAAELDDGAPIVSRHIFHADHARAGAWIADQLDAAGWTVTTETFVAEGAEVWNVVAELRGSGDGAPVVLGAHYDSTGELEEGWDPFTDPAPGAVDDASGVAALLEAARLLAAWDPGYARTIRIVAFSAEEQGMLGSFHHVEARAGEEVALMVQLDPVGYDPLDEGVLFHVWDARWPEAAEGFEATAGAGGTGLHVQGVDAALLDGDARSDHWPFWEAGYPALHLAGIQDDAHVHTPGDTRETVDAAYVTAVAGLAAAHVSATAGPNEAPVVERPEGCGCGHGGGGGGWGIGLVALVLGRRWRA